MKSPFRTITLGVATLALGLTLHAPGAHAASALPSSTSSISSGGPVCSLSSGLQTFFATRGDDTQLELQARKGLLYIVADCSKEETQESISSLQSLDMHDDSLNRAKSQLVDQLSLELSYVDSQKARVDAVGLQGTRDLARALKEWRAGTHEPQGANAANFQLSIKNQSLLDVANTRAGQIDQTLKTLKLSDRDDIKSAVNDAHADLADAQAAHDQANGSLSRLENPAATAQLLKTSFDDLSHAYDSFFKVSEAVKKILPL